MITIIYGSKGTGKTKAIIDKANETVANSKGSVIYITDTKNHIYELKHEIRYIMTKDYDICCEEGFVGFLNGIIANDHDIEYIFIDGAARIAKVGLDGMKNLFEILDKNKEINFILTISSDYDNIPPYIKKYIK